MFPSLIQSKYVAAKDITVAGITYVQEHARPFFRAGFPNPYFIYTMIEEYKVKERCISFKSDAFSYISAFWEIALTFLDTPIKQVFAMNVVLAIVFLMLNYFFIKLQRYHVFRWFLMRSAFRKPQDEDKTIVTQEHVGKDEERRATQFLSGTEDESETDFTSTETHEEQAQYEKGEAGGDNLRATCH